MAVYTREIQIDSNKIKKDVVLTTISDFGLKPNYTGNLDQTLEYLPESDILLIDGDIIDSVSDLNDPDFVTMLVRYINALATKGTKTIISFGNHDGMSGSRKEGWTEAKIKVLKDIVLNYTNAMVLDNEMYVDKEHGLNILGLTNLYPYYEVDHENKESYIKQLAALMKKYPGAFAPGNKNDNILSSHSAKNIMAYPDIASYFKLIISGHYHDGMVPPLLARIINGHRGLIDPQNNLFPDGVRGVFELGTDTTYVANSPVNYIGIKPIDKIYGQMLNVIHMRKQIKESLEAKSPKVLIKKC